MKLNFRLELPTAFDLLLFNNAVVMMRQLKQLCDKFSVLLKALSKDTSRSSI